MRTSGIAQLWHDLAGALPRPSVASAWAVATPESRGGALATGGRGTVLQPAHALTLAFAAIVAIDCLRYVMPADMRMALLYLAPVALATWGAGRIAGGLAAAFAIATSTATNLLRDQPVDAMFAVNVVLLLGTLLVLVETLARLRGALVRSDQRLLWVLDGLADALYVTDDTGAVLYGNRRFSAMFDRGDEPRTGRDVAARLVAVRGASGATATGAEVRDSRDGRRYRMQSSVIPWVGLTRVELHVLSDVTEETVEAGLHDAARAAVRHAARVSDMGETASILAHELNQPLVALVGYNSACLRLLETEPLDRAALTAALEKGRGQALRAGEIVHRLRELARRRAPQVAASDLNAIVRQQLAAMAPEIARADVELETSFAAGLDDIDCDGVLVGQVVRNLVDNGIDAMWDCPHGARRLLVATEPLPEHGVRITVADRGHGVTAAVAERMYTPFFTTRSTGLGLGLSICRSIAEAHHGRLWHSPRAAGGTAFHFTLP